MNEAWGRPRVRESEGWRCGSVFWCAFMSDNPALRSAIYTFSCSILNNLIKHMTVSCMQRISFWLSTHAIACPSTDDWYHIKGTVCSYTAATQKVHLPTKRHKAAEVGSSPDLTIPSLSYVEQYSITRCHWRIESDVRKTLTSSCAFVESIQCDASLSGTLERRGRHEGWRKSGCVSVCMDLKEEASTKFSYFVHVSG